MSKKREREKSQPGAPESAFDVFLEAVHSARDPPETRASSLSGARGRVQNVDAPNSLLRKLRLQETAEFTHRIKETLHTLISRPNPNPDPVLSELPVSAETSE